MTTLTINDKEVETIIAKYGEDTIIDYIKTFKLTPKIRPKMEDDLDARIRALKPTNTAWASRLKKAFESLNKKLAHLKNLDIEQEKQAYFDNKYWLWIWKSI